MSAICEDCGVRIHWLFQADPITKEAKPGARPNPVEVVPDPQNGKLVIDVDRDLYRFATGNEMQMGKLHGKKLYRSHFDTCPAAALRRRRKVKADEPLLFE